MSSWLESELISSKQIAHTFEMPVDCGKYLTLNCKSRLVRGADSKEWRIALFLR